jgi:hypothetical protein
VFHATLKCSYDYVKPSEFEGFRRVLGLRLTAEAIWNAVPFTFLIDWVLKVSKFLKQLDKDPNLTVNIKDYCWSLKRLAVVSYVSDKDGTYWGGTHSKRTYHNMGLEYWRVERSTYTREPSVPNTGYAFPVFDSLSSRELVLAGALIRANI